MTESVLQLHPADNVLISLDDTNGVPRGHKLAACGIAAGERVRKSGYVIGVASREIVSGEHVHNHNLVLDDSLSDVNDSGSADVVACKEAVQPGLTSFKGYQRTCHPDAPAGTRNYIAIVPTVNCSVALAQQLALEAKATLVARNVQGVDDVLVLAHQGGCGIPAKQGESLTLLQRTLRGYLLNPNVAGALVVGLGCEVNQLEILVDEQMREALPAERLQTLVIQEAAGTRAALQQGIKKLESLIDVASEDQRTDVPLEKLVLGLQCGGSDSWSALTANPLLGSAVDCLVAAGATAILAETPEVFGAERLLLQRSKNSAVAMALEQRIEWWRDYLAKHDAEFNNNPSPGNLAGGISTIYEKSLGAIAKGGTSSLQEVVEYGQRPEQRGLVFMDSPGYDPCSVTGEIAAGANLICFTTGRGSVFAGVGAPTLKLASNTQLFSRMSDDMDMDCGQLLQERSIDAMTKTLCGLIVATASGQRTCSESLGFSSTEFVPWQTGAVI